MARLDGKVAIITGAASGMGLAGAQLFAKEGAKVVMTDVSTDALEKEAAAISEEGGSVLALRLDVVDAANWAEVVEKTLAEFGRLDVLVNNAGVHKPGGVLDTTEDDWDFIMNINARGVWLGAKAVIPAMQEAGGGSIINVSSIAALLGGAGADGNGMAYSASKGAVRSMSKNMAQNFAADRIRVNSIHPGSIYTGLTRAAGISWEQASEMNAAGIPLAPHIGDPEDIGYGMVYLASDESKFVTGEELVIDGGFVTH